MTQAAGGRWREGRLPARVPGRAVYWLGEMGSRGSGASSREDEEAGLKHLQPEGEKARGGGHRGERPGLPSGIWIQITWGRPRKGERSGPSLRSPAF